MTTSEQKNLKCAPVEIIKGDLLKTDWFDADIVFINLLVDELLEAIADQFEKLKKGSRIISIKAIKKPRNYME